MVKVRYVYRWLGAIFLLPIFVMSFLIPRDSNIIIFGGRDASKFIDNSKYFFIAISKKMKNKKIIFITKNKKIIKELRRRGFLAEYIYSPKSFWYHLRAKYYIVDNTLGYLVPLLGFLAGSAKIIQLWHGIGFKKIEFRLYKAKSFFNKLLLIHILPWTYYFCDIYVLAPTLFYSKYFTDAFKVPFHKIIKSSYPRNDVFFIKEKDLKEYLVDEEEFEFFEKIISLKRSGSKLVLYAPTFRDTRRNINIFEESNLNIDMLNRILMKTDGFLILKLHPADKGNLVNIKNYERS